MIIRRNHGGILNDIDEVLKWDMIYSHLQSIVIMGNYGGILLIKNITSNLFRKKIAIQFGGQLFT